MSKAERIQGKERTEEEGREKEEKDLTGLSIPLDPVLLKN